MYTLANVEDRNREHPSTFHIPSWTLRSSLMVGDAAKLLFEGTEGEGGDRMWLEILEPLTPGRYRGKLLNDPAMISGIHAGDVIEFGPEHVANFEKEPRGGLWAPGLRPEDPHGIPQR